MAILFATSSMFGLTGSAVTYEGAAESRRAYTQSEIALTAVPGTEGDIANYTHTEVFGAGSGDLWFHFRIKAPTEVFDNAGADGTLARVLGSDTSDIIGLIDLNNGNVAARVANGFSFASGAEENLVGGTVYTFDFHLSWDIAGNTATSTLYVDGVQVSTITGTYNDSNPKSIQLRMADASGSGDVEVYVSEFIIADSSTIGMSVVEMEPEGNGANILWTGDYTDLLESNDGNFVVTGTTGHVETWTTSYNGPDTGETIHALVAVTDLLAGTAGPGALSQVVRVGGTNYFGTSQNFDVSGPYVSSYVWDVNPADSGAWAVADLSGIEFGFRADA